MHVLLLLAMLATHGAKLPSEAWLEADLNILATRIPAAFTPPDLVEIKDSLGAGTATYTYCFDPNVDEVLFTNTKLPDNILEVAGVPSTTTRIALHFLQNVAGAGNVVFFYYLSLVCPDSPIVAISASTTCAANGSQGYGFPLCYFADQPNPGISGKCTTAVTFGRDADNVADNFAGDACLTIAAVYRKYDLAAIYDP